MFIYTTDLRERVVNSSTTEAGSKLIIHERQLSSGQYNKVETSKRYLFYHHTAGWGNPYDTIKNWDGDQRGAIATAYVVGGVNIRSGNDRWDGEIVRCFEEKYWAFHLGRVNSYMHSHSIGIELCNFGFLNKRGGDFYTWANQRALPELVYDLGREWRGYRYFQRYTDKQIQALYDLTKDILTRHDIDVKGGLQNWIKTKGVEYAFSYNKNARDGKVPGILTHVNVVKEGKWDLFPQPELVDMILTL